MSFAPRPVFAAPAFDGMDLTPALSALWGEVPPRATLEKLRGDASTRSYYRVVNPGAAPERLIVMRLPDDPVGPSPAPLPFVDVQRHLHALGIRVPTIYVDDASQRGVLLLEDLGDETFEARLVRSPKADWQGLYAQAVDLLCELHERAASETACIAYTRAFDAALLRWELEHFREWGLTALGITLSPGEEATLDRAFGALVEALLALPQGFTHRDYQSRNLMWTPSGELCVIDFQDALRGPLGYDLAALLCDSYVALDAALQNAMLARYATKRGLDSAELTRAFRLVSVQRKLKDAGRFVFIDRVRKNPGFLPWYGPSVAYAARALAQLPEFAELHALLAAKLEGYPERIAAPPPDTGSHAPQAPA